VPGHAKNAARRVVLANCQSDEISKRERSRTADETGPSNLNWKGARAWLQAEIKAAFEEDEE
jgi:hypothetical protein